MAHLRSVFFLLLCALAVVGCSESHGVSDQNDGGSAPDSPFWTEDAPRSDAPYWAPDAPVWVDAGPANDCSAQDAHEAVCPGAVCDGLDSYAWDGERCVPIDCGACMGTDCASLPRSQTICESNHASCIPEMCRATGGEWLFYAQECLPYQCGRPQPAECLVGMPVCNCGDGRSFDPARGGCFDDTTCPVVDPLPPEQLCGATGGAWTDGICCPSHCGEPCALACTAPACVCGPLQVFDAERGCVDDAACHVASFGGECSDQVRCPDRQLCCQSCTGAGCDPVRHCIAPVCDADPQTDTCGNHLLTP